MRVDYRKLERDIPEIAARVEEVSGLKVPLGTLRFEVHEDFYGRHEIAAYSPSEKKIILLKENIPLLSSQDSVKFIVSHELMHHAQFSIESFNEMRKKLITEMYENDSYSSRFFSCERLVEGDATWVQCKLEEECQGDFFSKVSFSRFNLNLKYAGVMKFINGVADRYGLGKRIVDSLVASAGRQAVNCLYGADLGKIHQHFNDHMAEKQVTTGETMFNAGMVILGETIDHVADAVESLEDRIDQFKSKKK